MVVLGGGGIFYELGIPVHLASHKQRRGALADTFQSSGLTEADQIRNQESDQISAIWFSTLLPPRSGGVDTFQSLVK